MKLILKTLIIFCILTQSYGQDDFQSLLDQQFEMSRRLMQEALKSQRDFLNDPAVIGALKKAGVGDPFAIELEHSYRMEKDNIVLVVKVGDPKNSNLKIIVENGLIKVKGEVTKKLEKSGPNGSSSSMITRSVSHQYPVPDNVDENKHKIKIVGKNIEIIFPKKKNKKTI